MKPVILSKEFECRWFTHHNIKALIEDPNVLNLIESRATTDSLSWAYDIEEYCDKTYGVRETWGDVTTLCIDYVPEDAHYTIKLINGWETITYKE